MQPLGYNRIFEQEQTEDGITARSFQFNKFKNQSKEIIKGMLENPSF